MSRNEKQNFNAELEDCGLASRTCRIKKMKGK